MKVSTFIARRYLFSRKEKTVINIISWISLIGITVSTLALIVEGVPVIALATQKSVYEKTLSNVK